MLDISLGSSEEVLLGTGHPSMMGYRFSGKMGCGRSRRYFLRSTAAMWGSPKPFSETTLPSEGKKVEYTWRERKKRKKILTTIISILSSSKHNRRR